MIKIALQSRLLFCGRYELEHPAVHRSKSCTVMFAFDHGPRFQRYHDRRQRSFAFEEKREEEPYEGGDIEEQNEYKHGHEDNNEFAQEVDTPVALKFMHSREALAHEVAFREGLMIANGGVSCVGRDA